MKKINTRYESLLKYLAFRGFPFARQIYSSLPKVATGPESEHPYRDQMLGAFQPILDMGKDFVDTFKPYKATKHYYYLKRDLSQPIRGIGRLIMGLSILVVAPLVFLFNIGRYAVGSKNITSFGKNMGLMVVKTFSWLIDGVLTTVRGVSQIAATPLTWCIKIPLRGLITAVKGSPKIEDSEGVKSWIKIAATDFSENGPSTIDLEAVTKIRDSACTRLHEKFTKAKNDKGRLSSVDADAERAAYLNAIREEVSVLCPHSAVQGVSAFVRSHCDCNPI